MPACRSAGKADGHQHNGPMNFVRRGVRRWRKIAEESLFDKESSKDSNGPGSVAADTAGTFPWPLVLFMVAYAAVLSRLRRVKRRRSPRS